MKVEEAKLYHFESQQRKISQPPIAGLSCLQFLFDETLERAALPFASRPGGVGCMDGSLPAQERLPFC